MSKRHEYVPEAVDALEGRLALSGLLGAAPRAAQPAVEVARSPAPDPQVARFEVRWMREMIGHHGMAIRMARLAVRNTDNPEVRDLAHRIISAQSREIGRMRGWLASWYGVANVRPQPSGEDLQMLRELRTLRGEAFDRMFLEGMIGHHQAAIEDAHELLDRAVHAPLRQLGSDILTTQAAEIVQMRSMLGDTGGGMPHPGH